MSKYGDFSGPYFLVFSPNTRNYGPEKTPCLDTFHAVIVWASKYFVITQSSLLQTSIYWYFLWLQRFSPMFNKNINQISYFKMVLSIVLRIWFRSKFDFRKLSALLTGSFLIELSFLSQMNTFYRNMNDHWKCREQKENFQTILVIIFWNFTVF